MAELPELPAGFTWQEVEPFKVVFRHDESGKSFGVCTFGPEPLTFDDGTSIEIAYGVAKIERELVKDHEWRASKIEIE